MIELETSTPKLFQGIDCDDKRLRTIYGLMDADIYWHTVQWARFHLQGDDRPETVVSNGRVPLLLNGLMLQVNRPPFSQWHIPAGKFIPTRDLTALKMALVIREVVAHCEASAIDPSALLLLAFCDIASSPTAPGEASPTLSAANELNFDRVMRLASKDEDASIAAIASCLACRVDSSERLVARALQLDPGSWGVLIAQALVGRSQGITDSHALVEPVLASDSLPQELVPALNSAAASGVESWYDPFLGVRVSPSNKRIERTP